MQNQLPSSAQTVLSVRDLLMEILVHLPIESIIRFKLISKYWYSVITDSVFLLSYRMKLTETTGILFQHYDFQSNGTYEFAPLSIDNPASPFRKLKFTHDPSIGIKIKQSCNGLLLCSSFRLKPDSDVDQNYVHVHNKRYYICNPTTKRFFTLPQVQETSYPSFIHGMNLAFDPTKSIHAKVVCVWSLNLSEPRFQIEVYSSKTGSWRKSGEPFTVEMDFGRNGVYWNGAIHWICNRYTDCRYFRVDDETLHAMPMPPLPAHASQTSTLRLVESSDHLHCIEGDSNLLMVFIKLYEMKRDRSEWFVRYCIDFLKLVESYPNTVLSLLTLVRGKQGDDASLFFQIMGNVIRYDLVKNTHWLCYEFHVDNAEAELENDTCYVKFRGFPVVESFFPI